MSNSSARLSVCSVVSAPAARLDAWLRHVRTVADEIVLGVDAASGPETLAAARAHADYVSLVELDGLPNPAYGWIAGRATGDWILALDDDEVLAAEFVRGLPELLAARFTHFHLPIRWLVYDDEGQLAWIREFPWYPNHATRLFRNLPGCVRHPPELHGAWEVAGEGRALPAERGAILHLNLALQDREARERKMEQKYRRLARPELPSCEEYYLYEDYGPDLALVPLRDEPAAPAVLFGLPAPGVPHGTGSAEPAPAVTAHDLRLHSADQSEHPPIWSARYVEHDTPGEMGANRGHLVNVTVRNTSVGTWRSDGRIAGRVVLSYRWRRPDGELVIPQGDITLLPQALPPGEEARVVAGLWTPAEPGDYRLEWQMLCERVAWFSDHGVVPLEHEAHVVDRGPRPVAPHFPQPLTSPNHVRQRTSSGTAGVALTFDDGPDPEWTPRILERLRRLDAPATFFVLGARAAAHPRLLRRMRRDGHQIGLHGNLHLRHDEHAAEVISADTAEALSAIGGRRRTRLWRTPHGIATPDTERVAEEHGLELIHWTADTQDWQGGQTAGEMLARVEPLLRPGAVVLMHDGVGPGSPRENAASTLALLDPLVEAVRAKGLQLTVVAPG